jgi:hypothetical protein
VAILRQLGGGYARADAGGQFQIELPRRGRYLVLVVSHEMHRAAAAEIDPADLAKLQPYFDQPAELIGSRQYQLRDEIIRGDRIFPVVFE